jgi:uncharacterized membrane protein YfcA
MFQLGIGLIAGVLAGMFGIGGGLLIVPALITLARFPMTRATGTSLTALLLPVGALGVWEYYRHGDVDIRAAILIAIGLAGGAWLGALLGTHLPMRTVQRAFSVFLLLVAFHLWRSA